MQKQIIHLTFSDLCFGCPQFGFLPRVEDPDDEDTLYERHINRQYRTAGLPYRAVVRDGVAKIL